VTPPDPRLQLLAVMLVIASAIGGCAGNGTRMNDPQMTSSTVVAMPGGSERGERSRGGRRDRESTGDKRRNSDILVELGQRYYSRGEYQIALEKLQSALQIDPTSPNAHTVIAILYETINDTNKAAEHYRRSVQYGSRSGDVLNNYGSWLCRQRKYDEADEHFRRAIADPFYKTPESALANAGTCALAAGRYDLGENYLRQVLVARPDDGQALLGLAEVAFRKQDFMRARAFVQRAESQGALGKSALELAIRIEESLGDVRSAAAYRARLRDSDGI
jgi:type IV pilus assembly protein PilF